MRLVPQHIVDWFAAGERAGRFTAVTLFVDISGFTTATEALMAQQRAGAEALADVMEAVFAPLIATVYARGGFISGFAGDAFTAVFPTADSAPQQALAAAWTMLSGTHISHVTPFGAFRFGVKVGLAEGEVVWGVAGGRVAYFRGAAVNACAAAEQHAAGGQLVVTDRARALLADRITAVPVADGFWQVTAVAGPVPPLPSMSEPAPQPARPVRGQEPFVPAELLRMTARGEFRQVVTLFVNVQGGPQSDELEALMTAVLRLLDEYDGYLCRLDFGDKGCNLLFFWGAPVAHENDIARTLDFALALRATAARPLRMGITYRMVYAGFAGSELRAEYTCYGLSVNLAARLMTQAPWGDIWLDEAVMERAAGFEVVGIGRFTFKGFSAPQQVYRLEAQAAYAADMPFFAGQLVGRAAELAQLRTALSVLAHGRFAGAIVVRGEAGIGKSRLAHEALQLAVEQSDARVYLCQTDEILRQPLNPLRYMLSRAFHQHPVLSRDENRKRFEAECQRLARYTSDMALVAELERTVSFLGALVDLYWPDSLYERLEPELRFENTLDALKAFFRASAQQQPVIVQLEDAQWLDAESWQFVTRLLRNMEDVPLALVMTSREPLPTEPFGGTPPLVVEMGALGPSAVAELVADLLGEPPAPDLLALLGARSEGNPFYLEQLVRYLQEQDVLRMSAEGVTAVSAARELPVDIQAVLIARLDRLSREVRDVVQTAAVLGREFEVRVLSQMLRDDLELEAKLGAAEGAAVWSALTELRYIFRHALLQDAAYQMQLESRLAALHRLAAGAIEATYAGDLSPYFADLVYHYGRAGDTDRERSYARKAAVRAAGMYANADAIRYFSRALELTPADDDRARFDLLHGRVAVYHLTGDRKAQLADLQALEALAARLDIAARALTFTAYADYALETSDYHGLSDYAQQAIEAAQAVDDIRLELRGMTQWANALFRLGDSEGSIARLHAALAKCEQVRATTTADIRLNEASIHKSLNVVYVRKGEYELAREHILRSIELSGAAGDIRSEGNCYNNLALVSYFTGDYQTAREQMLIGLEAAERVGERSSMCLFTGNIGVISYKLGDVAAAQTYYERALQLQQEIDDKYSQIMTLNNLGVLHMDRCEYEQAIERYEQSLALARQSNDRGNEVLATVNLGLVAQKIGDFDTAVAFCDAAIALCREVGDRYHEVESLSNMVWVQSDLANAALARQYADEALALLPGVEDVQLIGHARLAAARVALLEGAFERALEQFAQSLAALEQSEVTFGEVRAECRAGRIRVALAQGGVPDAADVEDLLALIEGKDVIGALRELDVVWDCYRGLAALGDGRATAVLIRAHEQLQEQAARFTSERLRNLFLNRVAAHRQIAAAFGSLPDR